MYFNQQEYDIRLEWGAEGIRQLGPGSDAIVVIDVFSFTTAVDVALSRGARIYPYRWKDTGAIDYAKSVDAILAIGSRRDPAAFSLAPSSLTHLPENSAVVLPSPNGAALTLECSELPVSGARPAIFAGCLRNAEAVAVSAATIKPAAAIETAASTTSGMQTGPRISLIPAGERWPDGSLRPALEDMLGAGAIAYSLPGQRSPEAEAAVAVYLQFRERLEETLAACSSGKEAADRGSLEDVRLAAALNASRMVPRLVDGAYRHQPA